MGIGDLSRPNGGVFDERFGGRGHASHQNGLDVDVYYPRRDGQELRAGAARSGRSRALAGPRDAIRASRRRQRLRRAAGRPARAEADRRAAHLPRRPPARPHRAGSEAARADRPIRAGQSDHGNSTRRHDQSEARARGRLHPRRRVRRDGRHADPGSLVAGNRPLGGLQPQPGRLRPRPAAKRPRRRPEPQLPLRVEGRRPAVGSRVPRAAAALGAGDAGRRAAHPADQARGHDLVPPAADAHPSLGAEHPGGAAVRATLGDEVPRHPLASRDGAELAEPSLPGNELVRRGACLRPDSPAPRPTATRAPCSRSSKTALSLRAMLAPGDRVPDATVWLGPREPTTMAALVEDRAALFVFFLFAWSST